MAIELWQVFHVLNCRHVLPAPKNKFVVIACIDGGIPYGFFINSAINAFVSARPHRLVCEAPILSTEHPFLSYDSWIDCQVIYPYTVSELSNQRGVLSQNAITATRNAVAQCRVLERRFQRLILAT